MAHQVQPATIIVAEPLESHAFESSVNVSRTTGSGAPYAPHRFDVITQEIRRLYRVDIFSGQSSIALGLRSDLVVADPNSLYSGARLSKRTLVPEDDAKLGEIRFGDWRAQGSLKK